MPRYARKKTYRKKKSLTKKRFSRGKANRTRRRRMLTITPGRALFPRMVKVNLRYEDSSITLSTGAGGVPDGYVFRATSVFDPDFTGTGNQPRGYDQIAPFFENWIVTGAKCVVHAQSNATGAVNAGVITALTTGDSTVSADTRDIFEDRFTRKKFFGAASGGHDVCTVVSKYSAYKWHGATGRILMQNTDLIGVEGANPAQNTFFQVIVAPQSTGASSSALVRVVIDYSVIFFNPKLITPS